MPLTNCERRPQEWKIGAAGSAQRVWRVFGSLDIADISAEILAVAPTTWLGLGRDDDNITVKELGYAAWECSVPYNLKSSLSGGLPPPVFSFKIGGKTQKIEEAPVAASFVASGMTTIDYEGAINVDAKNKVGGTDVPARAFSFEMEHWITNDALTNSYIGTLVSLCTKYNNATFRGFAAGSVLYLGCTGAQDSGGKYRLSHLFDASPNISGGTVANGAITGVNKKGWQYLWVSYVPVVSSGLQQLKAREAYVHDWTTSGDFSLIGLET